MLVHSLLGGGPRISCDSPIARLSEPPPEEFLGSEGTSAAATTRRLRILEDKTLLHQILEVVERRVVEVEVALGIDKNARAIFLEHLVAIARFRIEPHRVRKPRTTPALHTHAQPAGFSGDAIFLQQLADFRSRFFGNVNHIYSRDATR